MAGRVRSQLNSCRGISLALLSLVLFASCEPRSQDEPLRVGINAWPGYEFLYLAVQKGFYREEGVEVQLVEFSSLADCRRAYERGQIDAMGTTVVEVLQARNYSARKPQIVRVVDYSNGADVILTREDPASPDLLEGARIGLEVASLGVYVAARGLQMKGVGLDQVQLVPMDQLSMVEAFSKGELDGMVTYPPHAVQVLREEGARVFFSTAEIPGEVLDVIAVDEEILVRRQEDIAALLRAFSKAMNYSRQHPDEAYAIMARREGITAEEFAEALTSGVVMLEERDQADYFRSGGQLEQVIGHTERILRAANQINRPVGAASDIMRFIPETVRK